MGLVLSVIRGKDLVCPKCGEVVSTISMDDVLSCGREWYPFLEAIGYYVHYDKRSGKNDWYGKDMKLTEQQTDKLYEFVQNNDPLCSDKIMALIALAREKGQVVIVNADW